MENTKIEWATHTFNAWIGCTKVGPGCDHCYAEALMDQRYGRVGWGPGEDRIRTTADYWRKPLKWDREAAAGRRDTVFCLSLGDVWDNEVDPLWRRQLFELIERTPNLIWLLLSKRIGNAIAMFDFGVWLPLNCALGMTAVNQEEWDRDVPKLIEASKTLGAAFTFVSAEPLLGPIDMMQAGAVTTETPGMEPAGCIDWVIIGGESGKNARPFNLAWARDLVAQCKSASVPVFVKQMGSRPVITDVRLTAKDKKGGDWSEWPEDLRIRERPQCLMTS